MPFILLLCTPTLGEYVVHGRLRPIPQGFARPEGKRASGVNTGCAHYVNSRAVRRLV